MSDVTVGTKARSRHRVSRLDGLRGLAVISVVVFHAETNLGLVARPGGGFVGVAVFFVLSGYLITGLLWRSPSGSIGSGYGSFIRRRFTRLAPALLAFVVIWIPVSIVVGAEAVSSVLRSAVLAATQTTAYDMQFPDGVPSSWDPTWSLSIEWSFYLTWPLVILLLRRRGVTALTASRVAILLGLGLYAAALPLTDLQFYYLPLANLSVLLWGGGLALSHIQRSTEVAGSGGRDPGVVLLGLALLVALTVAPGDQGSGYRWLFLPAAVVAALVVVDARPEAGGWANLFLELRPLRAVGLRAYSIYLWHVPVMWLSFQALPQGSPSAVAGLSFLVLVPVVIASFELFERPCLSGAGRGASAPAAARGGGAADVARSANGI